MKRRAVKFLAGLLLSVVLVGCGNKEVNSNLDTEAGGAENTVESGDVQTEQEEEPDNMVSDSDEIASEVESGIIGTMLANDTILAFYADGSYDRVATDEYAVQAWSDGEDIFSHIDDYVDGACKCELWRYTSAGAAEQVLQFDVYRDFEMYHGDIYVYPTYDDNYNLDMTTALCYRKDDNGIYHEEAVSDPMMEVLLSSKELVKTEKGIDSVDEFGIVYKNESTEEGNICFRGYDTAGQLVKEIELEYNYIQNPFFDGKYIVYGTSEYDMELGDYDKRIWVLDTETEHYDSLLTVGGEYSYNILAVQDGKAYFARQDFTNSITEYQIFVCDLGNEDRTDLYQMEVIPGNDFINLNGKSDTFMLVADKCYFGQNNELGLGLYSYDFNSQDTTFCEQICENKYLEFGNVYCEADTLRTEDGMKAYTYWIEGFELAIDYPGKDKINQTLKAKFDDSVNGCIANGEACLDYFDSEYGSTESSELNLSSVMELGDHYLQILFRGYEYMGGAHGFPYFENYLFDTATGEQITFKDMYQGSEEEFCDVVARYSLNYYLENEDAFYGFESEEVAYDAFYSGAEDDLAIICGEDCFYVNYYPYEYGPYSSGFIEIEIPYEELGIEL